MEHRIYDKIVMSREGRKRAALDTVVLYSVGR